MAIDPLGLKEGGKITHSIDDKSIRKIVIGMGVSSLAVGLILHLVTHFKKS